MSSVLRFSLLLSLLLLCGCNQVQFPAPEVLWKDFQARRALAKEHFEDALQFYYEIIADNPEFFSVHSNSGVLLGMLQRPEDAQKSLEHAAGLAKRENDPAQEFVAQFNLGVFFTSQKNFEKALESYQAALEVNPTSIETKTNIELLVRSQQSKKGGGDGSKQNDQKDQDENGQGGGDQNQDQKDKDKGDQNKNDENKDDKKDGNKNQDQKRESSAKYKPRPFTGEHLSEGDVKKILGELRNQEQKIRANFDKKEKRKSSANEKDW